LTKEPLFATKVEKMGGGVGEQSALVARDRRSSENKVLPLINADGADPKEDRLIHV